MTVRVLVFLKYISTSKYIFKKIILLITILCLYLLSHILWWSQMSRGRKCLPCAVMTSTECRWTCCSLRRRWRLAPRREAVCSPMTPPPHTVWKSRSIWKQLRKDIIVLFCSWEVWCVSTSHLFRLSSRLALHEVCS